MAKKIPAGVQLTFDFVRYEEARRKLTQLGSLLKGIGTGASTSLNKSRKAIAGFFGFVAQQSKHLGATIKSAIFRTLAYGFVNSFRNAIAGIKRAIAESAEISLMLGRSAAIITQNVKGTSEAYDNLVTSIADTRSTAYLLAKDLAKVNFTMAIAGVRGKELSAAIEVLDKMATITGESANTLSMDFIRMAKAFQISGSDFEKLGDVLIKGISNAVMMMPDLLNAVKMLAPTWVMAFGPGIDQAKEFTAAVAALSNVALKGGQGARYLNRFILGLLAPTQQTAALMKHMGIEVYEAAGGSRDLAGVMDKLSTRTGKYQVLLDKLVQKQSEMIAAGEDTTRINMQIDQTEERMNQNMKALETSYTRFIHAGGKLKPVHEILDEFGNALENNNERALEMFQLFKKIFQLRGLRATALIANIRDYRRMRQEMLKYEGALGEISKKTQESWGFNVKALEAAMSKIKTLLMETFGAPIIGAMTESIKEGIIEPLINTLKDNKHWAEVRDGIKENFKNIFGDLSKDVGNLFLILFAPEAATGGKLKRGTEEYREAVRKALKDVMESFKPLMDLLAAAFVKLGQLAGEGFIAAFEEVIATSPVIRHLVPTKFRTRQAMAEETWEQWRRTRQYKKLQEDPKKYYNMRWDEFQNEIWEEFKEAAKDKPGKPSSLSGLKGLGFVPGAQKGRFEKISPELNIEELLTRSLAPVTEANVKLKETAGYWYEIGDVMTNSAEEALAASQQSGEDIRVVGDIFGEMTRVTADSVAQLREIADGKYNKLVSDLKAQIEAAQATENTRGIE